MNSVIFRCSHFLLLFNLNVKRDQIKRTQRISNSFVFRIYDGINKQFFVVVYLVESFEAFIPTKERKKKKKNYCLNH